MSKNYDLIATVDISLESPVVDETSFDNLLIVGPLPKVAPDKAPPMVGVYTSIEEVVAAGWATAGAAADPVGVAAAVAFGQSPRPTRVYIAPMQMVEGEDGDSQEAAIDTVKRAVGNDGWYVLCPAGVPTEQYAEIAAFIEATEKMFFYTELDCFPSAGAVPASGEDLCTPTVTGEYYRTMWVYGRVNTAQADEEIPEANKYLNVAWAAKWLQYEAGSETAAFKTLAGVTPSELSTTEVNAIVEKNGNYFITVGNKSVTMNGKVLADEWADIIRFRDWQKNDMQMAVANLFIARPKVPYTDAGIALVQNQMNASLKRGQERGGIAETEFGENGETIPGFITSVPTAASIPASVKASRKLSNCTFKARLAGAIHFAELNGSLTYEL